MKKLLVFILLIWGGATNAQSVKVYGQVLDSISGPVPGATVMLVGAQDSILKSFSVSDKAGVFTLSNVKAGDYVFKVSFFGYNPYEQNITITAASEDTTVGKIQLQSKMLDAVTVQGHYVPIAIKGDTIEYDSRAFETDEHDVVEDLLIQLPGIEVNEDGSIKAQGKDVEKVLVDGEEFFADDPTIATKNLPADAVEKVQVFDKQSDMSEFTGVDDGNESTTINLKLKESHKKGSFGNLELAGGTDAPIYDGETFNDVARYLGKGNLHYFKKKWQFSIIGMSNNVNEAGFSFRDYINFMGGIQNMMREGGMSFNMDGGGLPISNGGGNNDGFVNTNAAGINLNFKPSDQTVFNASVFLSAFDKDYEKVVARETYFTDSTLYTGENVDQNSSTFGNTANIHFEQKADSSHFFNADLSGSWNMANYFNGNNIMNEYPEGTTLSTFDTYLNQDNLSYEYTLAADYRKKFKRPGNYLGMGASFEKTNSDARTTLDYLNDLYSLGVPVFTNDVNQVQNMLSNTSNFSANVLYSEPVGKRNLFQFDYVFRRQTDGRDKDVYDVSPAEEVFNDFFSAEADYLYFRHRAKAQHKYIGKKINTTVSATYQYLNLSGNDIFGVGQFKDFHYVMPSARIQWEPNKSSDLRLTYNTSLTVPNLNQLQPLPDNSNPSEVILGNTNLEPEYNHTLSFNFHNFNEFNFTFFMARLSGTYTQNNITYAQDVNEFFVKTLTPENIGDEKSANLYLTFGASFHPIFTKFSISNNATVSNGLVNLNTTQDQYTSMSLSPKITFENLNKKVISFRTGFNYSWSRNLYENNSAFNNSFTNFNYFARAKVKLKDRWVIQSDIKHFFYPSFENNSQQIILNAQIGVNLTPSRALQVFIQGNDLLNQNTGINQSYFQNIYEEEATTTLARYFMIGMKYSFKKFGAK